jgi:hypothetical protein
MAYESRLVAGVLLIVLPTVMIGGVSILPSSLAIRPTCRTRCVRICARRICTCRSLADTGPRGTSLRGRGQPLQYHQVVRPWLDPPRRDPCSGGLLPSRTCGGRHDAERVHLSRLRWRNITGCRCARPWHWRHKNLAKLARGRHGGVRMHPLR